MFGLKFTMVGWNSESLTLLLLPELRERPLHLEPLSQDRNGNVSKRQRWFSSDIRYRVCDGKKRGEGKVQDSEKINLWRTKCEFKNRVNEKMKFYEHLAKKQVGSLVKDGSNKKEFCHVGGGSSIWDLLLKCYSSNKTWFICLARYPRLKIWREEHWMLSKTSIQKCFKNYLIWKEKSYFQMLIFFYIWHLLFSQVITLKET